MKRLVIGVDCDDVLVRTTPFFVETYNKKYGTSATLADARNVDPVIWGADEATTLLRWELLTQEEEYKVLAPDPEEALVLRQLAQDHELHLITARKPEEREFTETLLNRELPGVFTSMEFVGWGGSKGTIREKIKADVMIDDNASHLHDAIAHGLPKGGAILFGDYPWNAEDSGHEALIHCYDWVSVKNVIDKFAES